MMTFLLKNILFFHKRTQMFVIFNLEEIQNYGEYTIRNYIV